MVVPEEIASSMQSAVENGVQQYKLFTVRAKKDFYDPIKKNSNSIFAKKIQKKKGPNAAKISTMKSDINLFSRMYIACQNRVGDMENFFQPSLASCVS